MKRYWLGLPISPIWLMLVPLVAIVTHIGLLMHMVFVQKRVDFNFTTLVIVVLVAALAEILLTGCIAALLADRVKLSWRGKERFMAMSSLAAALPPHFIGVAEVSSPNAYGITLVVQLLLLFTILRLLQHRHKISLKQAQTLGQADVREKHLFTFLRLPLLLARFIQLSSLPLLFSSCISLLSIISSTILHDLLSEGVPGPPIGYYASPLINALPFFVAALLTIPYMVTRSNNEGLKLRQQKKYSNIALHTGVLMLAIIYFGLQIYAYFVQT